MYSTCTSSRRKFISGLLGGIACTAIPGKAASPTPAVLGNRDRIDTHHHFFAPSLLEIMVEKKIAAKGKIMTIEELMKKNPTAKNVRIMG